MGAEEIGFDTGDKYDWNLLFGSTEARAPQEEPVEEPVEEYVEPQPHREDISPQVIRETPAAGPFISRTSEARRRLARAALYEEIIRTPLFEGRGPDVMEVEAEMQAFAQSRLESLLGISGSQAQAGAGVVAAEPQFDDSEVVILKSLCATVISRKTSAAPQKQRAPAPSAAKPAAPAPVEKPTIRKRSGGQETPEPPKRATAPEPAARIPAPAQKPGKPAATAAKKIRQFVTDLPPDGAKFIDTDGETYTATWEEISPDEYGAKNEDLISEIPEGGVIRLKNGVEIFNESGVIKRFLKKRFSGQRKGAGTPAFPSASQMTMLTASAAGQAVANASKDPMTALAAGIAIE